MEPTEGAFQLTKRSEVSSIICKVGSTEFTGTALGNDFILYYSAGEFGEKEVNLGKEGECREKKMRWARAEAHLPFNQWESGFSAKHGIMIRIKWFYGQIGDL